MFVLVSLTTLPFKVSSTRHSYDVNDENRCWLKTASSQLFHTPPCDFKFEIAISRKVLTFSENVGCQSCLSRWALQKVCWRHLTIPSGKSSFWRFSFFFLHSGNTRETNKYAGRTLITQPILEIRWWCECKKSYLDVTEAGNTKNFPIRAILTELWSEKWKLVEKKKSSGNTGSKSGNKRNTPLFLKLKKLKKMVKNNLYKKKS